MLMGVELKNSVAVTWKHTKNIGKRGYISSILLGLKDSHLNQYFCLIISGKHMPQP